MLIYFPPSSFLVPSLYTILHVQELRAILIRCSIILIREDLLMYVDLIRHYKEIVLPFQVLTECIKVDLFSAEAKIIVIIDPNQKRPIENSGSNGIDNRANAGLNGCCNTFDTKTVPSCETL